SLSIKVTSGGCHGYQYDLTFIKKTSPDSTSEKLSTEKDLKEKDVSVVIDSDSLALLNGTTLDFQRELIGSSFKIVGGNMKSSCGCGSSFDL
ncbi:hypothetical protein HANVADRAFT_13729, partial [Hanseniaspora valbyensis NRRL Y-1626]